MTEIVKITPDKERARSLLETVSLRQDLIKLLYTTNSTKFASKIIEEYYESLAELITAILSVNGLRLSGDLSGSHLILIDYLRNNFKDLKEHEIQLIDELRKKRIGIKYYGKQVKLEYVESNEQEIRIIIEKLKSILNKKL